jgi:hypothetical protein
MSSSGEILRPTKPTAVSFGVCDRTISRWENNPKLGFPRSIKINGRKYYEVKKLEQFKAKLLKDAGSTD